MEKKNILSAICKMAEDDNQGLKMSTTIVDVHNEKRGSVVSFGTEKECGDDARVLLNGLPNKYIICAFFIDRKELEKYDPEKM